MAKDRMLDLARVNLTARHRFFRDGGGKGRRRHARKGSAKCADCGAGTVQNYYVVRHLIFLSRDGDLFDCFADAGDPLGDGVAGD